MPHFCLENYLYFVIFCCIQLIKWTLLSCCIMLESTWSVLYLLDGVQLVSVNTFSGFNLTTRDLHFTILVKVFTNHILAENTYFTNHAEWIEHNIMVLKPANKNQIIRPCHNSLITDYQYHALLYRAKVLQTFIYYLIYFGARKVFCKIMEHKFYKAWFLLLFNMRQRQSNFERH